MTKKVKPVQKHSVNICKKNDRKRVKMSEFAMPTQSQPIDGGAVPVVVLGLPVPQEVYLWGSKGE